MQDTSGSIPDNADVYVRYGEVFPDLDDILQRHFRQEFAENMLVESGEEGYASYWPDNDAVIRVETTMWDADDESLALTLVDRMPQEDYEDLVESYHEAEEGTV